MNTRNTSEAVALHEHPKTSTPQVFADDVQEYLSEHGLDSLLLKALGVATTQFDLESPAAVRLVEDDESGEKWVEINVRARGELSAVRAAHCRYTEAWLGLISPELSLKIRLSIRIA